jgi:cellulose synthase/poly-beta-1,6-N-acetylglucosamine synthase-like glycosyltransferase
MLSGVLSGTRGMASRLAISSALSALPNSLPALAALRIPPLDYHLVFRLAIAIAASPILVAAYAYVAYPAILWAFARRRARRNATIPHNDWPAVTITVPVYNAVSSIRTTLERLLELDYPKDRLQLLVLSDASNDGTDDVVREFAGRGIELIRAASRRGKTAAENAAVAVARGDIIVNVDATVVVPAGSLKRLIRAFDDPTVGVASGRDLSVGATEKDDAGAESGYTGYEMWVRDLETRAGTIVGASGCFYGIRRLIRVSSLPSGLSWDFASTLIARQEGYRSVSVPDAVCIVPRTAEIRFELRRKARTMARGLSTLFHFRALMNPFIYGRFALILISHKLLRWVPYLLVPVAVLALALLATQSAIAALIFAVVGVGLLAGSAVIIYGRPIASRPLAFAGFAVAVLSAGFLAWWDALRGTRMVTWEPTPRPTVSTG